MKKINARMSKQPLALLVLVAVLVGACSGVAYAASRHPAISSKTASAPAALVWHNLKLLNGAHSNASGGTGNPQYAVSSQGVVYLAGSISAPTSASEPAFIMPAGARPGYYDCFPIYSNDSSYNLQLGAIHIYANGKADLQGVSVTYFSSLSGISFVKGH